MAAKLHFLVKVCLGIVIFSTLFRIELPQFQSGKDCGGTSNCNCQCGDTVVSDCKLPLPLGHCANGLVIKSGNLDCNSFPITGLNQSGVGVEILAGPSSVIKNCTIKGFEYGVEIDDSASGATIQGGQFYQNSYGVYINPHSTNTLITGSIIRNNSYGIYNAGDSSTVNSVSIHDNTLYGIFCTGGSNNTFSGNIFLNNATSAFETADATNNSWNTSDTGNNWGDFQQNPGFPNRYEIPGPGNGVDYKPSYNGPTCANIIYHPEYNPNEPAKQDRIDYALSIGYKWAGVTHYDDGSYHWYGNCRAEQISAGWNADPNYTVDLTYCASGSSAAEGSLLADAEGDTPGDSYAANDSGAAGSPGQVPEQLALTSSPSGPAIQLAPGSLAIQYHPGDPAPTPQTVTVNNIGTGTLSWTAVESPDVSWLTFSPASGSGGQSFVVTINPAGLLAGTYTTRVLVIDPYAINSPQDLPVTLTIPLPDAPSNPSPPDGQIEQPVYTTLSWNGGQGTPGVTFDVYLDAVNPPMGKVASGLSAASFRASLASARLYYWQVVAISSAGQKAGPVWSFGTRLLGDINGDGYVNVGDLQLLVAAWGSFQTPPSGNWNPYADVNGDGWVNLVDLWDLVANWGRSLS